VIQACSIGQALDNSARRKISDSRKSNKLACIRGSGGGGGNLFDSHSDCYLFGRPQRRLHCARGQLIGRLKLILMSRNEIRPPQAGQPHLAGGHTVARQ